MDVTKFTAVLAKGEDAALKGSADMWRNVIADTTLALLEMGEVITRDSLRAAVEIQISTNDNKFERARLLGALNVLNGRQPHD